MAIQGKIRVIIVDDIAETRENIRKLLQFESDVEVIGVARTGKEAIDLSKEVKPDVILMDINMPDMDGIAATEAIRRVLPYAQIVILSVQSDSNYMRRAMLAGARDFLTKPPTIDELNSAIRRAGAMAHEERAKAPAAGPQVSMPGKPGMAPMAVPAGSYGHVITVYSPKGGSGTTMLATNLAMSLNNEDTTVLLVDGNLQFGDVAVFLNEQSKFSVVDLAPRVDELDPEVVESVIIKHAQSGVRILAAPTRPEYADNVNGDQFSKVLNYLRQMYPYVIVDTTSMLNDITVMALDASDIVVLLATQDIPAIKNARLFLDVADSLGIHRRRILFVMNKFDKRIGITPEKVGENLKQEVNAVIPFEERVIVSVNRGIPFLLADKTRPLSRSILSLTETIRQRLAELEAQDVPVTKKKSTGKK
ncbi:MAG TPA: response regulator [Anaerolineales bacterium]|nr:response regulator [Anaerolineales bacterium]